MKAKKNRSVEAIAPIGASPTEQMENAEKAANVLSREEKKLLKKLEKLVDAHKASFLETAVALVTINESGLYRAHGTFAEYCEKRFDIKRAYAYKLMAAGKIHKELEELGAPLIMNESQARALGAIESKEQRAEVMQKAREIAGEDTEIRGEHLTQAIEEVEPDQRIKSPAKKQSAGKKIDISTAEKWLETISKLHKYMSEEYSDAEDEVAILAKLQVEIEAALGRDSEATNVIDIESEQVVATEDSEASGEEADDDAEDDTVTVPEAA